MVEKIYCLIEYLNQSVKRLSRKMDVKVTADEGSERNEENVIRN